MAAVWIGAVTHLSARCQQPKPIQPFQEAHMRVIATRVTLVRNRPPIDDCPECEGGEDVANGVNGVPEFQGLRSKSGNLAPRLIAEEGHSHPPIRGLWRQQEYD